MDNMGTITLNPSDDVEHLFRRVAKKTHGVGKGKLKKAFEEAVKIWAQQKEEDHATQKLLEQLETGFPIAYKPYKRRDDLYDRSL